MPPCGGHPKTARCGAWQRSFKSCPRVGGILWKAEHVALPTEFQVVPPCGGHLVVCVVIAIPRVSSRAPVWGASRRCADTVGAGKFQVVPPCGGHQYLCERNELCTTVSSRAPVWGASYAQSGGCVVRPGFKSCPRVGGIRFRCLRPWDQLSFKSCPRVGGIKELFKLCRSRSRFQVVPPCGGHPEYVFFTGDGEVVSSRAPVWGASPRPSPLCW